MENNLFSKINNIRNNAKYICDKLNDPNFNNLLWVAQNEKQIEDIAKSLLNDIHANMPTKSAIRKPKTKSSVKSALMQQRSLEYQQYLMDCCIKKTSALKWHDWLKKFHPAKNGGNSLYNQIMNNQ